MVPQQDTSIIKFWNTRAKREILQVSRKKISKTIFIKLFGHETQNGFGFLNSIVESEKIMGQRLPDGSVLVKNLPVNAGDSGETWVRSLGWEDPLEEETATHSNILAWEIPWTEKPGGLESLVSQRVRCDLATKWTKQFYKWGNSERSDLFNNEEQVRWRAELGDSFSDSKFQGRGYG